MNKEECCIEKELKMYNEDYVNYLKHQLEVSEQKRMKAIKYINDYQEFYRENYTTDLDEWKMEEEVKRILGEENE